uniref:Uncharacterized protein n=1 Tax=Cacopsylla melanoneura TaxID=428564 RepID=A0A8D9B1E4_9HEMI
MVGSTWRTMMRRKSGKCLDLRKNIFPYSRGFFTFLKKFLRTTEAPYLIAGKEALCILLRRLAYPNRWTDLEPIFGLSAPYMSKIGNIVLDIIYEEKGRLLLQDLRNLHWLTEERFIIHY